MGVMTLEDLGVGPVLIGTVKAGGRTLTDRKVALVHGFVYVETTSHGETDVVAYPGSQVDVVEDLRPGPAEPSYAFGI